MGSHGLNLVHRPGPPGTVGRVITQHDSFELDDDPRRLDRDAVWRYLSTEAYWGRWRTRAQVEQ